MSTSLISKTLAVAILAMNTLPALAQSATQATTAAGATTKRNLPPEIAEAPHWHREGMEAGQHIMRALSSSGVELTDDQVEKMTAANRNFMTQVIPAKDRLILLAPEFKDLFSAPDLDDSKIRDAFKKVKVEIDSLYAQAVEQAITVAHIFTPDQRHKLRITVDRVELGPLGWPQHAPPPPPPAKTPADEK